MEPGENSDSDVSSPENDQRPDDTTGMGRSYECTFCKRGFTNAQALGGHMNIHRKDKSNKAKQKKSESSKIHHNIVLSNENHPNLRCFSQTDHHQQQQQTSYYRNVNYQNCLPPSNPSFETRDDCSLPVWGMQDSESDHHHVDVNLSLRIGSVHDEDGDEVNRNVNKEVELDLELRLGHA